MSGEFGQCNSGYFHTQMQYAAEDCVNGEYEITRRWGDFLATFASVAKAISWAEASDSSQAYAIMETISKLPVLEERLRAIAKYVEPYRRVADEAVREAAKADEPCN